MDCFSPLVACIATFNNVKVVQRALSLSSMSLRLVSQPSLSSEISGIFVCFFVLFFVFGNSSRLLQRSRTQLVEMQEISDHRVFEPQMIHLQCNLYI